MTLTIAIYLIWFIEIDLLLSYFLFTLGKIKEGTPQIFASTENPCQNFFICVANGENTIGSCPTGTSFDNSLKTCRPTKDVAGCFKIDKKKFSTIGDTEIPEHFVDGDVGSWRRYKSGESFNPALWGEVYNEALLKTRET